MTDDDVLDPSQFLGLPDGGVENAAAAVLPLPLEKTVSWARGTGGGPGAIIKASHQVEFFDEETLVDLSREPLIHTAEPLENDRSLKEYLGAAEERAKGLSGKFVVALGGEHTITRAVIKGLCNEPECLHVVQIDAHADLIDRLYGRRWSHGTVIRRIHELGCSIIQVGIRSLSREEYDFAAESDRVRTFFAHEMSRRWSELLDTLLGLEGRVYLTVDIDGIDPSLAPSTGTPQPGGLNWEQLLGVARAVAGGGADWIGADIVEFIPSSALPGCGMVPARLLAKMLAYRFLK